MLHHIKEGFSVGYLVRILGHARRFKEASSFFKSSNVYLFMGTEADCLPNRIVEISKNVQIPSLSSSINVGNAFSIILTCMIMASMVEVVRVDNNK